MASKSPATPATPPSPPGTSAMIAVASAIGTVTAVPSTPSGSVPSITVQLSVSAPSHTPTPSTLEQQPPSPSASLAPALLLHPGHSVPPSPSPLPSISSSEDADSRTLLTSLSHSSTSATDATLPPPSPSAALLSPLQPKSPDSRSSFSHARSLSHSRTLSVDLLSNSRPATPLSLVPSTSDSFPRPVSPASHSSFLMPSTTPLPASHTSSSPKSSPHNPHVKNPVHHDAPSATTQPPFLLSPSDLSSLFDPKNPSLLSSYGGAVALCTKLAIHPDFGVRVAMSSHSSAAGHTSVGNDGIHDANSLSGTTFVSVDERKVYFGENIIPQAKARSLLELMWGAFQDKILILLTIASLVSLSLGLYSDLRSDRDPNLPRVGFVEGLAIILAVIIVVMAGSVNDLQKERQFRTLNSKKEDRQIRVVRDGTECLVHVNHVVVGDVVVLEPGDVPCADGVLIRGTVDCDESALTGETDNVRKYVMGPPPSLATASSAVHKNRESDKDPFILSGSKVVHGTGRYVVCCVGERSVWGRTLMGMRHDSGGTPLQVKLDELAEQIAKLGGAAALLMLVVLFIKYIVGVLKDGGFGSDCSTAECAAESLTALTSLLISSVTILVVAVPEGLPLAVTLALAYGTTRMLKDGNLVRVLS
ncbi:hypothetical protein HDU93_008883, partial [Gonapodya sp. JEL0774]